MIIKEEWKPVLTGENLICYSLYVCCLFYIFTFFSILVLNVRRLCKASNCSDQKMSLIKQFTAKC